MKGNDQRLFFRTNLWPRTSVRLTGNDHTSGNIQKSIINKDGRSKMAVAPAYNASNGTSNASQPEHIPAWKRLGLELKHTQGAASVISSGNAVLSSTLKRPLPDTHVASADQKNLVEPLMKKRRVDSRTTESSQSSSNLARTPDTLPEDKSTRLKKKVSFTAETKLEDGGKELFNDWEQDDFAYYEQKAADNDAKEARRVASNTQNKPQKLPTRSKKPSDTRRKSKDALDYLNLYHTSPDAWKFNKNREVWILRRILSTDDIPASFDIALASYVHGLRSRQARSRLLGQCHHALKEEQEASPKDERDLNSNSDHMEDPSRRKAYHDEAVRRFKRSLEDRLDGEQRKADENDPEYQRWLSRRRRAELLLWAVTSSTPSTEEDSISSHSAKLEPRSSANVKPVNETVPNGHIFKKKNRTAVVEVSSSSEEESGSSDDEDDGGSELANRNDISNGATDFLTSAGETSSAASSVDSDSSADAEFATIVRRVRSSTSSSESESETDTHFGSGKRRQSAITISSTSESSRLPMSSTSAASSTEEDDEDETTATDDTLLSSGDDSEDASDNEDSSGSDVEENGPIDSD